MDVMKTLSEQTEKGKKKKREENELHFGISCGSLVALKKKTTNYSLKDASIRSFIEQYFLNTYYIPVTFSDY